MTAPSADLARGEGAPVRATPVGRQFGEPSRTLPGPIDLPRIVFVIDTLTTGGAERQLVRLVRMLDRSRWDVSVFCLSKTGKFVAEMEALGVTVYGSAT